MAVYSYCCMARGEVFESCVEVKRQGLDTSEEGSNPVERRSDELQGGRIRPLQIEQRYVKVYWLS